MRYSQTDSPSRSNSCISGGVLSETTMVPAPLKSRFSCRSAMNCRSRNLAMVRLVARSAVYIQSAPRVAAFPMGSVVAALEPPPEPLQRPGPAESQLGEMAQDEIVELTQGPHVFALLALDVGNMSSPACRLVVEVQTNDEGRHARLHRQRAANVGRPGSSRYD